MAHKRGARWVGTGYDRTLGRKRHLGTYTTRREAQRAEADWKLRARPTGSETCDQFAERWQRDYPRPRASTRLTNEQNVKRFARDFAGVKLVDVDRPAARVWANAHRSYLGTVRAMFGDAVRDGLLDSNPFAQLRLPGSRGRSDIVALTELELQELAELALAPRMELGDYAPQYRALILCAGYVGCDRASCSRLRGHRCAGGSPTLIGRTPVMRRRRPPRRTAGRVPSSSRRRRKTRCWTFLRIRPVCCSSVRRAGSGRSRYITATGLG